MAMPQCCYLAKGAKRPSHTTNTIKFDRIPFDPCNSIKRFDLCPFDQKNSTYLQPPAHCNSLLYGAQDYMIKKLQRVQNRAACLLLHQGYSNVYLLLNEFHWLPVERELSTKSYASYTVYNDLPVPIYLSLPFFSISNLISTI